LGGRERACRRLYAPPLNRDVSDLAQSAAQSGHGNKARLLRGVLRQLDQSLENASEGFLQAKRNFAQASRNIEAVQAGRQAATRGRTADVIPAYQALWPEAQAAFRSGYVDRLIAQTEGAAFGVNKARPFSNHAFGAEANAVAAGNELMQRRLGRELWFRRKPCCWLSNDGSWRRYTDAGIHGPSLDCEHRCLHLNSRQANPQYLGQVSLRLTPRKEGV